MKITKLGHCCLIIETKGKRIMTDPGGFSADSHVQDGIDLILITHEHADHVHVESLKELVEKNPAVLVVTNSAVGKLLEAAGIEYQTLEGTSVIELLGIAIEACDGIHAEIFEDAGKVQNTGYFIDRRLFYPGDAYTELGKPVEILALPVGGPWCRTTDSFHYALKIAPKQVIPVHDGIEREDRVGGIHNMALRILGERGVNFTSMKAGDEVEF